MGFKIRPKSDGRNSEIPQIIAILATSFGSLSNGILCAWTSPAIPELVADKNITLEAASYLTVIPPVSMLATTPLISLVLEAVGLRIAVLLISVPMSLSWIFVLMAENNIWMYYISRIMSGIGDATLYVTIPVYVCEIAQPRVRGVWGNAPSTCVTLGIFVINILGFYNDVHRTAMICVWMPILHFAVFWCMPESPYYLLKKGDEERARECLKFLRWNNDVEKELLSLKADVQRQLSEEGTWKDLIQIESNRKALLICILIRAAQQFAGLGAFETYARYMFQEAAGDTLGKTSSIVCSGLMLFLCVVSSAYIVERLGRRPLMILSCIACGIVLLLLTTYLMIKQYTALDVSDLTWAPLVGLSAYTIALSPGLCILPSLVSGELFSSSIKNKAGSVMNVVMAVCFLIIPKLFELLTYHFGISSAFLFFTICCFIFAILSHLYVIETKGKTLEEIQQVLKGNIEIKNEKC